MQLEFYPMSLREPLRPIRVPLRKEDGDIVLNLQPLVEMAYKNGRYDRTDYRVACLPPLEGADAEWAEGILKSAGKRAG